MKRVLITVDEETAKVLDESDNKSKMVRDALAIYQKDISTDTLAQMKQAFMILMKKMEQLEERFTEAYEISEGTKRMIEELYNR